MLLLRGRYPARCFMQFLHEIPGLAAPSVLLGME